MVFGGIATGKAHDALLAEGLARALRGANTEAEVSIAESKMGSFERYTRIANWIRGNLDAWHDERIFREVVEFYGIALAEQSLEAVGEEIEELPSEVVVGLNRKLWDLLEAEPSRPSPQGELLAMGQFLGAGLRQLYLGAAAYGADRGIIQPEAFGISPGQLRDFVTPGNFVLVDAEHLRNLRLFETVIENLRRDWGHLHPTVRGFSQVYGQDGWLDETGANRLRPLAEEVETFVTRPHH